MTNYITILHLATLIGAGTVLLAAAYSDARRYRIPNRLCVALLALFPIFVVTAPEAVALWQNLTVFALVLCGGFLLFAKGFIGAGDIKLLAATSLWAGPDFIAPFLFITAVAGGLLGATIAGVAFLRERKQENKVPLAKIPLPYGIAIAIGGICLLLLLSHSARIAFQV